MNTHFSRPLAQVQMTIDIVVFSLQQDQLQALVINRAEDTFHNQLALPGGFLQQDETTLEAARRVLYDKTGVQDIFMEQLYTFDALDRDPRGRIVSVVYYALVPPDRLHLADQTNPHAPALRPVGELHGLAFDHDAILTYALQRLRSKLAYTNVAYSLLSEAFTLTALQRLYEIILGRTLDKRNFRKKYLSLGFIEPTAQRLEGGRHRPAQLYRFSQASLVELSEPAL